MKKLDVFLISTLTTTVTYLILDIIKTTNDNIVRRAAGESLYEKLHPTSSKRHSH